MYMNHGTEEREQELPNLKQPPNPGSTPPTSPTRPGLLPSIPASKLRLFHDTTLDVRIAKRFTIENYEFH